MMPEGTAITSEKMSRKANARLTANATVEMERSSMAKSFNPMGMFFVGVFFLPLIFQMPPSGRFQVPG